jgi:hypothetical protein
MTADVRRAAWKRMQLPARGKVSGLQTSFNSVALIFPLHTLQY